MPSSRSGRRKKKSDKICIILLILLAVFSLFMIVALSIEGAEIHGNAQFGYIKEIESFAAEINLQFGIRSSLRFIEEETEKWFERFRIKGEFT